MSEQDKAFDRDEALRFAWTQVKANVGFFAAWIGIDIVASLVFGGGAKMTEESVPALSLALNLISNVLQILIGMGVVVGAFKMCDGKKPEVGDLFASLPLFWKYL